MGKIQKIGLAISTAATTFLGGTLLAFGQSVPTWDASSTETVVTASASALKTTFVYVLQVIAPYAIIITLIVGVVYFFVRLAHKH
jgi:Ca2+/Na+ antiporter